MPIKSVLQELGIVFLQPGNNLSLQLASRLNRQFQRLLRYIARGIVTGYIPLFRESPHLLDHLGVRFDGQFERLNRLRTVPDLGYRAIAGRAQSNVGGRAGSIERRFEATILGDCCNVRVFQVTRQSLGDS